MSSFSHEITRGVTTSAGVTSRSILAVVVLYNRPFRDVPSAKRLREWLTQPKISYSSASLARCLIYDNSPVQQSLDPDDCQGLIDVFHNPSNGGTRAAYLLALKTAREHGYPWVLFLDHDTDLPKDFLLAADNALSEANKEMTVCAIVPSVFDGQNQISPAFITEYGRGYVKQGGWGEIHKGVTLTAIASASLVRTESLCKLLPIPEDFTLDYLDHWLFRGFQYCGESIIVSSARVEHSLSVQSMRTISVGRYRSILAAELLYLRSGRQYSVFKHLIWHTARSLKVMWVTRRPELIRICVTSFLNIIYAK